MRYTRGALLVLIATLVSTMAWRVNAQSIVTPAGRPKPPPATLKDGILAQSKLKEAEVEKLLKALGPAFSEQLRAGREVELPGVGVFRVVRINEYRDLVNGRLAIIPARNFVEFIPGASLEADANSPNAKPSRSVDGFEFRVNPNSNPGIRTPTTRNLGTRTR